MPVRNEVFTVADRLHRAGTRVTVRAVRDGLGRGGSFSDVGPLVAEWKAKTGWRLRPPPVDMPVELQDALNALGTNLWQKARTLARAELESERARIASRDQAWLEVRAEIGAAADAAEMRADRLARELERAAATHASEMAALERELDQLRSEIARRREAFANPSGSRRAQQVDPARAEDGASRRFWDDVMQEIADVLARTGEQMDAETLLHALSAATRDEAGKFQKLTPGILAKKMSERAKRGRYFRQTGPGIFAPLRSA